jgi:hypothetical protein
MNVDRVRKSLALTEGTSCSTAKQASASRTKESASQTILASGGYRAERGLNRTANIGV